MNLQDYLNKKQEIEKLQRESSKSEGILHQLTNQLKDFGIENVKEAEKTIKTLEEEIFQKEKHYNILEEHWNKEFGSKI